MVCCLCCARRDILPNPPFIMPASSWLIRRFYRCRVDIRAEALAQSLDRGIRLERSSGPFGLLSLRERALPRGRFEVRLSRFERDANIPAEMLRQALHELVVDRPRTPIRGRLIYLKDQYIVLEPGRHAIQGKLSHHAA